MKKRSGINRALPVVPTQELESWPTTRLLGRLKRLRFCEEVRPVGEYSDGELATVANMIMFKQTPVWKAAYRDVKAILDKREHVARPARKTN